MDQVKIGKFISDIRKERNLTQKDVAEKLGVSINAVSKWERGISLMDISLLKPLSILLGVSITEIINGEKDNKDIETAIEKAINYSNKNINKIKIINKIIIIISLIVIVISFGIILYENRETKLYTIGNKSRYTINNNYVTMSIKDNNITDTKAVIVLNNNSDYFFEFGSNYLLEKEIDGIWYECVAINNLLFTMPSYRIEAKDSYETIINWENTYGKLPSGRYRIIKNLKNIVTLENIYVAAEFML